MAFIITQNVSIFYLYSKTPGIISLVLPFSVSNVAWRIGVTYQLGIYDNTVAVYERLW